MKKIFPLIPIILIAVVVMLTPNKSQQRTLKPLPEDMQYQVQLTQDSIYLLDGNVLITVLPLDEKSAIGRAIINDNQ